MSKCVLRKISSGLMGFFSLEVSSAIFEGIFAAVGLQEYLMFPEHRISSLGPEEEK